MAKSFFITGATGFIGARLAQILVERGDRVKSLVRPNSRREKLRALGVELVEGDLADRDALENGVRDVDAVIHLGGLTRELRAGDFMRVNRDGSAAIADAIGRANPNAVLVATSSLACAGVAPAAFPLTDQKVELYGKRRLTKETDALRPVSPYGKSKLAAERALCERAANQRITIVRPPYVFGEGDMASVPLFRMMKRYGNFVSPGWLDRYFSFVYVDDLALTLIAAAERGERLTPTSLDEFVDGAAPQCSGEGIYFAASPKPILFSEFGRMIGRGFGRERARVFRIPPFAVYYAALYGEVYKKFTGKLPSFDMNKAKEALRGPWICSSLKAREQLDVPLRDNLEAQIHKTAQWYLEERLA